jgi:polynucleotide 5'-kinase involved in rRNA processing
MATRGEPHSSLRERIVGERGVIMLMGNADTGKTTLAKFLILDALAAGLTAALIDADVAADTVGPPACAGLKRIATPEDFTALSRADELRFVGSTEPSGVMLSHVVAVAVLVEEARVGADLVVVDTPGLVPGVTGQTLEYHLVELCSPALVIAMQRGGELEPSIGMLQRFLGVRIARTEPHDGLEPLGPVEQRQRRIDGFRRALRPPLPRWRVQPTVFAPTLPEEYDFDRLHGMLVGVQDGEGRCLGLGVLEHEDGVLRVATHHGEQMKGLRLGSLQVDLDSMATTRVRLRQLIFGV